MINEILTSIANRGLSIIGLGELERSAKTGAGLFALCERLMSSQGEAAGFALSREIFKSYDKLSNEERTAFFVLLEDKFSVNDEAIEIAARTYLKDKKFKKSY